MKTKLLKGFAKVVCILFVVAFVFGMIYTVGQVVPSTRGVIHKVARLVFLESFAQRYLPIESAKAHQTEPSQENAESAPAMEPVRDIMLSPTAAGNLGLNDSTLAQVEVIDYYKSLILPAVITERPGLSTINIPAPLSGVITKIYHETGVAVTTGTALFDILLNQQDMIQTQSDYIAALKAQEINESEIARLSVLDTGIAPQKRRELTFEKERLSVDIANKKRTLELLGLPPERIGEQLEKKRELIKSITIYVPNISEEGSLAPDKTVTKRILTLDRLDVTMGQNIVLGESLCQLSDLNQLVIQGKVFASDETKISTARLERRRVSAVFGGNGNRETVEKLHIRSIDNRVDVKNGIIYCYVDLKNQFDLYDAKTNSQDANDKRQYVQWHFRPGQRCELQVEYEKLPNCIVLPIDAVAEDIGEMCLFQWVGAEDDKKIWRKTPVHVLYKTKDVVVIANDGAVFPGAKVATKGAGLILAALAASNQKAAGGGGIQHGDHVH